MATSKTKKPAKKKTPPRKTSTSKGAASKAAAPSPKIAKKAATKVARGGAALARPLVTKRLISKRLAKSVERAEPALRRGKPEVSSFGHAKHVQGSEAEQLRGLILAALSKGPRSFESLQFSFSMITENQLRYQLVILRTDKLVRKVGAREATVYELLPAAAARSAATSAARSAATSAA